MPLTVEDRINSSTTSLFKAVFPDSTNHYDTLFGGAAMHLMDEVAFITATRFTRHHRHIYLCSYRQSEKAHKDFIGKFVQLFSEY